MTDYPEATRRGDKIFFYPVGLHGNNTVIKTKRHRNWYMKTLGTLRQELNDEEVSRNWHYRFIKSVLFLFTNINVFVTLKVEYAG